MDNMKEMDNTNFINMNTEKESEDEDIESCMPTLNNDARTSVFFCLFVVGTLFQIFAFEVENFKYYFIFGNILYQAASLIVANISSQLNNLSKKKRKVLIMMYYISGGLLFLIKIAFDENFFVFILFLIEIFGYLKYMSTYLPAIRNFFAKITGNVFSFN